MEENHLYDIVDAQVLKLGRKQEIMCMANLAKRCLNMNAKRRPTIKEVATDLERIRSSTGNIPLNFQEDEYERDEVLDAWDVDSTSTSTTDNISLSIDIQPLLTKRSMNARKPCRCSQLRSQQHRHHNHRQRPLQLRIVENYTKQTLASATDFIRTIFQQYNATDRKNVTNVTLFIDSMDGVAYAIDNEIHVNHGNGEAPGGLIEGIADFLRLKTNYAPSHWVQPGQGEWWDEAYDVTAKFLDYLNGLRNGVVAELNRKMRSEYSDNFFTELIGKTVDQLWLQYKA
ncbi:hypothetical protein Patl1_31238 [Pistacia atlantica]|uniref:Uncharacterized protein n=1 Tax=Pistacia atlantica TaxID=434234 RepID=A0ACC1ACH4_9ROSI|nr:hypothetical protein Patl1_31238 [Pistacia atlantica]